MKTRHHFIIPAVDAGGFDQAVFEGAEHGQGVLIPSHLDDFIDEDNPIRAVDAFVHMRDLHGIGFITVDPCATR